jgi:hypothetical protein
MFRHMLSAVLFLSLAGLFATPAKANLVTNGGFETGDLTGWTVHTCSNADCDAPTIQYDTWTAFDTSSTPGWMSWFPLPYAGSYDAQTGCTNVAGDANPGCLDPSTGAWMSQNVPTLSSQLYSLGFDLNMMSNAGAGFVELDVYWNNVLIAQISPGGTICGPNGSDCPYTFYSFSGLPGAAGTSTLQFVGRNDPGQTALDNVDVEVGSSVPEPAALLLAGGGLIALASMRRRLARPRN